MIVAFLVGHAALALAMWVVPAVSTLHALVCLGVGVGVAATTRRPRNIAIVVAYIVGSEVLWRMTRFGLFHEFGKYAISLILVIALARMRARRNRLLALGYFVLLLPSVLLTLTSDLGFDEIRKQLSFNLSGPLSLSLCVIFFSSLRLTRDDIQRVFFAVIGPAVGIAAVTAFATAAVQEIEFTGASNFATSGGFGPNQVSSAMGLGLLLCLLLLLERGQPWRLRLPLLAVSTALAAQAALTFSRGGLILALAGMLVAVVYLVRDSRTRVTLMLVGSLLFGVGKYVVIPQLEVFTQGKLSERYSSIDPSGRGKLAGFDLEIFSDAPLLGVGPGVAPEMRKEMGHFGAAHTEFTRLLAEHGFLGGLAILILIALGVRTVRDAKTLRARAFVMAMLVWVTLFLAVNAMRMVAPSFMFGLACALSYSSLPLAKNPRVR